MSKRGRPGWPQEQIEFLRIHASSMTAAAIGAAIGRTRKAVLSKVAHMDDVRLSAPVGRPPNGRRAAYIRKYKIPASRMRSVDLTEEFMDQLDHCKDDESRRLLLDVSEQMECIEPPAPKPMPPPRIAQRKPVASVKEPRCTVQHLVALSAIACKSRKGAA